MGQSLILMKVYLNNVVLDARVEGLKSNRDLDLLWDDLTNRPTTSAFWNSFIFLALNLVIMKDYKTKKIYEQQIFFLAFL